jgi:lipid-A-disaccharide synthase
MIVAGEASGDIYGAELVREALQLDPELTFFGIGGVRMREAGVETIVDSAEMAVMGLVEVFNHIGTIASAFLKLKKILFCTPPELLILIDYPGFNLRLAKAAKKAGVKVLYYISPKVWAWKAGRVRSIAASVSRIAVIFPFEVSTYEAAGVPVTFVGHPLHDMVVSTMDRPSAAESFGLDPARRVIGLFPGSRRSEIERMLPTILASARLLLQTYPDSQFVLPLASTLRNDDVLPHVEASGVPIVVTRERIHDLIRACDAVISVSGTVTLEIALVGTPLVIIYKLAPLTYQLAKRLVKVSHIGLCNIVTGETVAPELIQDEANPQRIVAELRRILDDQVLYSSIQKKLAGVRSKLGCGGASANVARLIPELIGQT